MNKYCLLALASFAISAFADDGLKPFETVSEICGNRDDAIEYSMSSSSPWIGIHIKNNSCKSLSIMPGDLGLFPGSTDSLLIVNSISGEKIEYIGIMRKIDTVEIENTSFFQLGVGSSVRANFNLSELYSVLTGSCYKVSYQGLFADMQQRQIYLQQSPQFEYCH